MYAVSPVVKDGHPAPRVVGKGPMRVHRSENFFIAPLAGLLDPVVPEIKLSISRLAMCDVEAVNAAKHHLRFSIALACSSSGPPKVSELVGNSQDLVYNIYACSVFDKRRILRPIDELSRMKTKAVEFAKTGETRD